MKRSWTIDFEQEVHAGLELSFCGKYDERGVNFYICLN